MKKLLALTLALLMTATLLPLHMHTATAESKSCGQCSNDLYCSFDNEFSISSYNGSYNGCFLNALWHYNSASPTPITLSIDGGNVYDNMVTVGDEKLLAVQIELVETTEDPIFGLVFQVSYNPTQIAYKGYQGSENFYYVGANVTEAGRIQCSFVSVYGIVVIEKTNAITLYFALSNNLETGAEIAFTLEDGYAETGDVYKPTTNDVVAEFLPFVVTEHTHTASDAVHEKETLPTCTEGGQYDEVVYCTVCGEELSRKTVTVGPLGHDLVHHDAKDPTCTEIGWEECDKCSRCDYMTCDEIPALGHNPGESIRENEVAPTEMTGGHYDEVVYCTRCGLELSREHVTVPPLWEQCGDDLYWSFDEETGTLTIVGSGAMYNYNIKSAPWDSVRSEITSVVFPDEMTSIGGYAFTDCTGLTSIVIPDSVTSIGEGAFGGCTGLTSITMPCSTSIGKDAFTGCTAIAEVHLTKGSGWYRGCVGPYHTQYPWDPNGYETYDSNYFFYTPWYVSESAVLSITLDEGINIIDQYAFHLCENLHCITLPSSVTWIGTSAFNYCGGLTEITIGNKVSHICEGAFFGCGSLTDVYYNGTKSERETNLYQIMTGNDPLLDAQWHYLTEAIDGAIEWNSEDVKFKGTTAYVIANGSAQTPRFTVKNSADGSVVDPANYDFEYRENTNAGTGYVIVTFKGDYTGTCRGFFKIYLPATTKTWVENVSDGIKVGWEPVEGAAGYVIYRRAWSSTTNGWTKFERWNNTTETTYIDGKDEAHKVYAGTRYQYGVKAYFARRVDPVSGATIGGNVGDNYNLGEVGQLKTTVRITTRKLVQVRPGNQEMTVKWEASKNFTGYQIKYATDANFTKNVVAFKIDNPTTYWTTIKGLKSNTTYYVCIRSYHEFNGMTYFGEWSNVLSCKVK